jgi:hypothetical protein
MPSNTNTNNRLFSFCLLLIVGSFFAWEINRLSVSAWGVIILAIILTPQLIKYKSFLNDKLIIILWIIYIAGGFFTFLLQTNPPLAPSQQFFPTVYSGLVPLSIFVCIRSLATNGSRINSVIKSALLSMIFFFILVSLGFLLGFGMPIYAGVDQFNVDFKLGNIKFNTAATWTGAMAAMVLPITIMRLFTIRQQFRNQFLDWTILIIILITYLKSFTRGATAGIILGIVVLFALSVTLLNKRAALVMSKRTLLVGFILLVLSLTVVLPIESIDKFTELRYLGIETPNIRYRINLFEFSYLFAMEHFHGIGFGTLWIESMIDEVNYYSWSANGTGLLGIIGFWGVTIVYLITFVKNLRASDQTRRCYSIAGISTLLATYTAAMGNDKILYFPQSTIPFWAIITCCYLGARLSDKDVKM